MNILCDTCSVLMLIRIAPDMFTDERFDCITIDEVRREVFETQKFKPKYPWRDQYRDKIKTSSSLLNAHPVFAKRIQLVEKMIFHGTINSLSNKLFDLSSQDRIIASAIITLDCQLSSTDKNLVQFLAQEFDKNNRYPLEIVNDWLREKLIEWNDQLQRIIENWMVCNEPSQPKDAIKEFEKLTGYKYPGT